MSDILKPGLYEHFKGGRAIVIGEGKHSEAHHMRLVAYREFLQDGSLSEMWFRPKDMFVQRIVRNGYDGPRFWRIGTWNDALVAAGEAVEDAGEPEPEPEPEPAPAPLLAPTPEAAEPAPDAEPEEPATAADLSGLAALSGGDDVVGTNP